MDLSLPAIRALKSLNELKWMGRGPLLSIILMGQKDPLALPSMEEVMVPYIGKTVTLGIRPEDIYDKVFAGNIATAGRSALATVEVVEPMGSEVLVYLNTGKNTLVARVEPQSEAKVMPSTRKNAGKPGMT